MKAFMEFNNIVHILRSAEPMLTSTVLIISKQKLNLLGMVSSKLRREKWNCNYRCINLGYREDFKDATGNAK
eukprot:IDg4232t1